MVSPCLKDPLFNPSNYVILKFGNCLEDVANPEFKFPKDVENVIPYNEFTCSTCTCKFMIKSEAISKSGIMKCPNYQCPAYIKLNGNIYASYIPWSCSLI